MLKRRPSRHLRGDDDRDRLRKPSRSKPAYPLAWLAQSRLRISTPPATRDPAPDSGRSEAFESRSPCHSEISILASTIFSSQTLHPEIAFSKIVLIPLPVRFG
ncbi:hypothetical protein HYDPIDRAFT_109035 [Hydnomerulius pinastri MD-312]|nr:hypothetical protein HYDPIDRAFT_109035 [Hydnomerulius pinastri MD-312]